jgi:hypothetical protein
LHKNFLFWLATLLPLLIALYFASPLFNGLELSRTVSGYSNFITIFSLPLWISSASIILGVTVSRFHSSEQRAITIRESINQNNFSNYLNHRDHFQKYIKPISDHFGIEVDPFKIYGIIFSTSTPFNADVVLSSGIYDFFSEKFEMEFWSKMKHSTPNFTTQEVNIYFLRFAKSIGINAEKIEFNNFHELNDFLVKTRKVYRRAMEYGITREVSEQFQEIEEYGFSMLIGEFSQWAQVNNFNCQWR